MRVVITTEINLENGTYKVTVRNVSHPGVGIDAELLKTAWGKVIAELPAKTRLLPAPTLPN